ncbi:MAG: 3-phosphoshikimate 1-carboxyvinyltransferase [Candidatus Jacksonbacteria bacterium RIFOXYA2_FULL_43_12]|nr:MAG: 3-phosphoshikimate 1-carboxyvinyltransferase [Candidatus Jacksonbacteria bacterium RIFOXYA2_FULL_43_12]
MPTENLVTINLPGSKSITNRVLICAALAKGRTRIFGWADCEDSRYMISALKALGVRINFKFQILNFKSNLKSKSQINYLEVWGGIDKLRLPKKSIYVGNAGTTLRFLVTLLGLVAHRQRQNTSNLSSTILTGSIRMRERPVGDLLEALVPLGVKIESVKKNGCPPLKIQSSKSCLIGRQVKIQNLGGRTILNGGASSQYLSSILLSAPYFEESSEIKIQGKLTSRPYAEMTQEVMQAFGVKVTNKNYQVFKVPGGTQYHECDFKVAPDASAASYFMAGAVLSGKRVQLPGLKLDAGGDVNFIKILQQLQPSARFKASKIGLDLKGGQGLRGGTFDLNDMPDMVPTLAVLAMFAAGRTRIKNIANLRLKETDRLRALATEIRKFGVAVKERPTGLEIVGCPDIKKPLSKIIVETYNDHRLAMAFAVAKLILPGIIIKNPKCVAKSFPDFWQEWKKMQ